MNKGKSCGAMDGEDFDGRFMDPLLFRFLRGDTNPEEDALVMEWRTSSADNDAHYLELARLLDLTATAYCLDVRGSHPRGADLIRLADPISSMAGFRGVRRFRSLLSWNPWMAVSLVAAVMVAWAFPRVAPIQNDPGALGPFGAHEFVTGPEDVITVTLLDGTVVRLAPDTRLRITGNASQREVTLEGRAYFAVAKRAGMPFTVKTSGGDVSVLGTRFEAEARRDELRLLVVEGMVEVAAGATDMELTSGEMVETVAGAISRPVKVEDIQASLTWTGNFLAFQATPIEQAAHEVSRHFASDVEVVGEVGGQTVTAWFGDETFEDVMRVLCKVVVARCSVEGGKATIYLGRERP